MNHFPKQIAFLWMHWKVFMGQAQQSFCLEIVFPVSFKKFFCFKIFILEECKRFFCSKKWHLQWSIRFFLFQKSKFFWGKYKKNILGKRSFLLQLCMWILTEKISFYLGMYKKHFCLVENQFLLVDVANFFI